jgi:hypothetical protein
LSRCQHHKPAGELQNKHDTLQSHIP